MGKSGAGRLWSSMTLTSTFTRFTLTRILPRCVAGSCESVELSVFAEGMGSTVFPGSPTGPALTVLLPEFAVVELGSVPPLVLDLFFCAQGGRSDCPGVELPRTRKTAVAKRVALWAGEVALRIGN